MSLPDSGKRAHYSTGSVRDSDEGKPRPSLLPAELILAYCDDTEPWRDYGRILITRNRSLKDLRNSVCSLMRRKAQSAKFWWCAAQRFTDGAAKYDDDNWRRGQPISRYIDSLGRHTLQRMMGDTSEDHYSAECWNLIALDWTVLSINQGNLPLDLDDWSDRTPEFLQTDPEWPYEDESGRVAPPAQGAA